MTKLVAIAIMMAAIAADAAPKKQKAPPKDGPVDPYAESAPVDPYAQPAKTPAKKKLPAPTPAKGPAPVPAATTPTPETNPIDPYAAAKPDKNAPPQIPSRVGLSDLTAVQLGI